MPSMNSKRPAGILLDAWKFPIFDKVLTEKGYQYENVGEIEIGVQLLYIQVEDLLQLQAALEEAEALCQKFKEESKIPPSAFVH